MRESSQCAALLLSTAGTLIRVETEPGRAVYAEVAAEAEEAAVEEAAMFAESEADAETTAEILAMEQAAMLAEMDYNVDEPEMEAESDLWYTMQS